MMKIPKYTNTYTLAKLGICMQETTPVLYFCDDIPNVRFETCISHSFNFVYASRTLLVGH